MSQVKERPILFNGEMVRAILEGRKTQTRRVIKKWPPKIYLPRSIKGDWPVGHKTKTWPGIHKPISNPFGALTVKADNGWLGIKPGEFEWICPYGKPGDLLWVRETFSYTAIGNAVTNTILYRADGEQNFKWRPSCHMPHWASRLTLKIINLRVERLDSISVDDILAEGIHPIACDEDASELYEAFADMWDSINEKRGYPFGDNFWVWVISFKKMEAI